MVFEEETCVLVVLLVSRARDGQVGGGGEAGSPGRRRDGGRYTQTRPREREDAG